ncbi:methyl-accepting chemotaxis, putative [Babesia ovata]|uniref:Methyl-accepting chemotaxis, putative n=1 Tax=Babesia ovata TaxID=189622 RepID=A0A2H6K8S4_9APIC|nr:methyl-accepting chemotaxis, putative [Babesia ovata]GBE59349.1 methyl-accepting chemotaxis, putative [Babesia ovata]
MLPDFLLGQPAGCVCVPEELLAGLYGPAQKIGAQPLELILNFVQAVLLTAVDDHVVMIDQSLQPPQCFLDADARHLNRLAQLGEFCVDDRHQGVDAVDGFIDRLEALAVIMFGN